MKQGSIHGDQVGLFTTQNIPTCEKVCFFRGFFCCFIYLFVYLVYLNICQPSTYFTIAFISESYHLVYTLSIQFKKNHATCIPDIPIQVLPTSLASFPIQVLPTSPGNSFSLTDFSVLICARGFESTIFLSLPEQSGCYICFFAVHIGAEVNISLSTSPCTLKHWSLERHVTSLYIFLYVCISIFFNCR